MTNRFAYTIAALGLQSMRLASDAGAGAGGNMVATPSGIGQGNTFRGLFQQLAQSLATLSGVCELVLEGGSAQARRMWLQPSARQAEAAMHRLRARRLTRSPALTELSQSLTVLVLAADMVAQGQLSDDDAMLFYDLLRRNADIAIKSLNELRAQVENEM